MSQSSESTNLPDEMTFNVTQRQLWKALSNKDLHDFEIALDMGADPLCPNDQHVCVYELALSTYGCGEFVQQCLKNGCSPHYVNQHLCKAAINYAADSKDPRIVRKLLSYPSVRVNHICGHLTPLISLAINATNDNVDEVILCFERLLEYGASPLIADQANMTAKHHIMANDNLKERNKKQMLESMELLDSSICTADNDIEEADTHEMKALKQFLDSIKHSDNVSFDLLMEGGVNYNGSWNNKTPFHQALMSGNSYALKRLLMQPDLNIQSVKCPLMLVISLMNEEPGDYRQCFYMLLKYKRIDINKCNDWGSTALHSAVLHRNNEAIRELLKRGACIGVKNNAKILALDGMPPELLQECLDNGVTSNGYKMGDTNFEICMNYENLMSPLNHTTKYDEMAPISFIVNSKVYSHLIYHPLIISFLFLKWRQLRGFYYTNFLLYVFFAVSVVSHTMLKFSGNANGNKTTVTVFWIMSWFGIVYMIIRECWQMVIVYRKYFYSKANYVELTMIALAVMTCMETNLDTQTQRIIAVCLLLLIAVELFLLLGALPAHSISTHMVMFQVVCKTFLTSFLLYSIFVVTFGFCFYILFGGGSDEGKMSSDEDFNKFTNPLTSIVKTIVMLTGEFDAGDMEFNTFYTYMLFLLFVFLMTMVLYNLLNGLAVSDIQAIKGQAKQTGAICSINLLTRYEGMLSGHSERLTFRVNLKRFHPLCRRIMNRNPKHNRESSMGADIERNTTRKQFAIDDRRIIKMAMKILERKTNNSRRQQRMRNNENRFNNIDRRLEEIYEILENRQTEK